MKHKKLLLNLSEAGMDDIGLVGGKNASLGEMLQNLSSLQVRIPSGFIITVQAYQEFLNHNKLEERIKAIINRLDADNMESLRTCGHDARKLVSEGEFPEELARHIAEAYRRLSRQYGQADVDVAVRSSATAEDLPDASFAGQQETYLNISGIESIYTAVKNCFASLFTDRAISYRERFHYNHFQVGLAVCIQKMVRSDLASSGVAFSLDTESGFKDAIIINGAYGLGELVVQGAVSPDEFILFKPTLRQGYPSIIDKRLGIKDKKMVYGKEGEERVKTVAVHPEEQARFSLSDSDAIELARWVMIIEDYYTKKKGSWCPMDIEWAVDGQSQELYIVQARPETIHSGRSANTLTEYAISDPDRAGKIIIKGIAVGDKIASGKVKILRSGAMNEISDTDFAPGSVLVTDMTDPDWEPIMKKASAIITNKGGRTCHAAIVARELGVPAIVGSGNATELLKNGQLITASCAEGDIGIIYAGAIPFRKQDFDLNVLPTTRTPVMLNVASPQMAFHFSRFPNKGVGLAREEFIINNYIQVHPLALLRHQKLNDKALSGKINQLIRGYPDGATYFIEKLSCGIARIAASFFPKKVIVRFSDFKSNEYSNLLGGNYFEPDEENPMIGWRGASRYYSEEYQEAFGLECRAIRKVREELGLMNVTVMIPFCRTVNELLQVYRAMEEHGLKRGKKGLEVYLMAELPSNIILAREFAQHIDGFSIGSNDLTQLVLGLDRDSSLVAHLYDERSQAVKEMIKLLIQTAKQTGVKVGICGQGPSDFPDFARFLVEEGIDTISVTPDSIIRTIRAVYEIENKPVRLPQSLTGNSLVAVAQAATKIPSSPVKTLGQFIIEKQYDFPYAKGELSRLLRDIGIAAKIVNREVNKAGLINILGDAGTTNIQGEDQKKLDVYANEQFISALSNGGECCIIASEENDGTISVESEVSRNAKYAVAIDPLDGSSNIDVNVAVGTIFSIYRRKSVGKKATIEDVLQKGRNQVAAGYVIYGSSTMLVYTTGRGVNGFTLDPSIGEFCLSHPDMKIPKDGTIYSINEGNYVHFPEGVKKYIKYCQVEDVSSMRPYTSRYIGSMATDIHRSIIKGGVFIYPPTASNPGGKLRLLYECNPLAFIIEQAGGRATTGFEDILDVEVTHLHQRSPVYIGSANMVKKAEEFLQIYDNEQAIINELMKAAG